MRGAPLHVYYIQFGQYTHPMGSGRPPWAAGEFIILQQNTIKRSPIHKNITFPISDIFTGYRCCYCYTFNPARRQKPNAPKIEPIHKPRPPVMAPMDKKVPEDSRLSDGMSTVYYLYEEF